MTEEEAKEKWCPMVKATCDRKTEDEAWERLEGQVARCITSDCMMWREYVPEHIRGETYGYCGLADKP